VVTTAAAKGSIDESGPFAGGVITGETKELSPEIAVLDQADLILGIGLRNTEVIKPNPFKSKLVVLDNISGPIHDGFDAFLKITVEDMKASVSDILPVLKEKGWGRGIIEEHRMELEIELFREDWMPAAAFRELRRQYDESTLVLDTGLFCTVGETVWKAKSPRNFCGSSVGRFMGTALPTSIGVSISSPGSRVFCVMGDGGIRPYFPEIRLAIDHGLPICFILMSDGRYGTVAQSALSKNLNLGPVTIKNPSWWRAVGALDCPSQCVNGMKGFLNAMETWQQISGPLFLEMHFDPDSYMNMTKRLR
jgi:acetolactate synthase-1/2/3 large subunit